MITAQEAKRLSDKNCEAKIKKAEEWARGELEYIEDSIQRAIEEGKHGTDYWWSHGILEEAGIQLGMAAHVLKIIFNELGYDIYCDWSAVTQECDDFVFRIIINWENAK